MIELFDTEKAAEYVGLKPSTLEKRRVQGLEPRFVRLGRLVKYRRVDLDRWVESGLSTSTSQAA